MRLAVAVATGLLLLRTFLLSTPGYAPDLLSYQCWALRAGTEGVHAIYDPPTQDGAFRRELARFDYPPLYAYFLAPLGAAFARAAPEAVHGFEGSRVLGVLVKLPPLAFDVLMGALLGHVAGGLGLWRGARDAWWKAACFYWALPAVVFGSGHWGQPDAIHTFFVVLAMTLVLVGRFELGFVAATLGALMKPLALPFLPLLAFATLVRGGVRRVLSGGAAAACTALVVFLPFLVTGRAASALKRVIVDVGAVPFTSVNAHNLWWLVGPWRPSDSPSFGPITPNELGLVLFAMAYFAVLASLWRYERRAVPRARGPSGPSLAGEERWFMAAGLVAFSFFFLSTHMHENHLFAALPFFVLLAHRGKMWWCGAMLLGTASFVNMADHDLAVFGFLSRVSAPSHLVLPNTTLHFPQAIVSIATANAFGTALLFGVAWWAYFASIQMEFVGGPPSTAGDPPTSTQ